MVYKRSQNTVVNYLGGSDLILLPFKIEMISRRAIAFAKDPDAEQRHNA